MDENLIKELNKFLKGVHMGGSTFKDYLEKAKDSELRDALVEIIESFKRHEEAITHRIEALGGNASDSVGVIGEMAEFWEKIKLMTINHDREVCEQGVKAIEMGIKNGDKFIEEHKNMDKSLMNDIEGVVQDYGHILNKLKRISEKF